VPTVTYLKEIAKFASGAEAFHAAMHALLWFSGATFSVFGTMVTPTLNFVGAVVNAVVAIALGAYAWGSIGRSK
jgi:hypothetical protein